MNYSDPEIFCNGRPTRAAVKAEEDDYYGSPGLAESWRQEHAWRCWSQLQLFACWLVLRDFESGMESALDRAAVAESICIENGL